MSLSYKIISELKRYKDINNYIKEQAELPDIPGAEPTLPAPGEADPGLEGQVPVPEIPAEPAGEPIDVEMDDEVTKIDGSGESEETEGEESEELEITDLVNSQKNIEDKQEEYFETLFSQLSGLEEKLSEMDSIMNRLNSIESKIEKYREKTPEEKLELRSYDSYPFNKKLSDFFVDKKDELEKTGKNEYILTSDEVEDFNPSDIENSFTKGTDEDDMNNF